VSKTKKEFKKATEVPYIKTSKRASINKEDRLKTSTRLSQLAKDLPAEVKKFIDESKGRYPTLSL